MKKLIGIILCFCMIIGILPFSVSATEKVDAFGIAVKGFTVGAKRNEAEYTVSDDRLKIIHTAVLGTVGEDDTLLENEKYTIRLQIKLKSGVDAEFPQNFQVDGIMVSGIDAEPPSITNLYGGKSIYVFLRAKAIQPGKNAEENLDASLHQHCRCGGYIEIGDHTEHTTVKFMPWDGKSKITYNSNKKAYLYLTEDVQRDTSITVSGGKTLVLCLNGHAIQMTGQNRVANINVGGRLELCNCTRLSGARLSGGAAEYGAGIHNNGTFVMYGGVITQNNGRYGGGIYNNANVYMYGGDIYDNKAQYGGGVWNDNDNTSTFIMYEGTITLNTASCGGAVWNNDGAQLTLKGGNVLNNVAGTGGGAVWNNGAMMELDGTLILENCAKWGGGIWNNGGTVFIKSGNVSKNIATANPESEPNGKGGGIWNNGDGLINMTGGEITFNKAAYGGGVWCCGDSEFVMSGGVIAENQATLNGGGIYIERSETAPGKFRMTGNAGIVLNMAYETGGGAYVEGILNMDGDAEIIGNIAGTDDCIEIKKDDLGQIIKGEPLPTHFIDIKNNAYYLEPVKWAIEKNITTGTTDVTFSPDEPCNTGQILTFLWRAAGCPQVKTSPPIADANEGDYYYMAAYWGQSLGIFDRALYPNFSCNRMVAVYFIWCAAGRPECKTPLKFTDLNKNEHEKYKEAIAWAVEQGITSGISDTEFGPGKSCTRAQIVTFLRRAASKGLI